MIQIRASQMKRCKGQNLNCKSSKSEASICLGMHYPLNINMCQYPKYFQPRSSPKLQCVVLINTSLFRYDSIIAHCLNSIPQYLLSSLEVKLISHVPKPQPSHHMVGSSAMASSYIESPVLALK